MRLGHASLALLTALLCGSATAWPRVAAAADAVDAVDAAAFRDVVAPFFEQHCVACHGPKKQKADLTLHNISADFAGNGVADRWIDIADQLLLREMPPDDRPRPDARRQQRVLDWITAQLHRAGRSTETPDEKVHHPAFGNRIDHDALFDPAMADRPVVPARPRIWRLNPQAYERLAHSVTKRDRFAQPFAVTPGHEFKDYASLYRIGEPSTELLIRNAYQIAEYQTSFRVEDGKVKRYFRALKEAVAFLEPGAPEPTREMIESLVQRQFREVVRREPTGDETRRYVELTQRNLRDANTKDAVKTTLAAILLSPEVMFRWELGDGPADEHGRARLAPREIAYAIALTLTDDRPDGTLLRNAEDGKLDTRRGVADAVRDILDNDRRHKPRILRFFHEYFGYHHAPEVFKNKKDFREHRPKILVQDTDRLIEHILNEDRDVFRRLLTTNKSFVNFGGYDKKTKRNKRAHEKDLAEYAYNVDAEDWSPQQPMELPADQRAGVLTQPAWLVAWSQNFDNDAIRRGKWVRERLLGGVIPDVPITVDAQLPDEPDTTLRHRMRITREEYCWRCHSRMNPLGLTFEMYDHFGRFRIYEQGGDVDATGVVDRVGDKAIEGGVTNAVAMIHRLAESDRVRQVFVRHVFRYFMGRNETLGDAPTLIAADRAYVASGGSFKALITSILTSDSFLLRRVTPDPEADDDAQANATENARR